MNSHLVDAEWRPKPHTGLTQDVGEGRAAASAAAGSGEREQRGEQSLGLNLMLCVPLEDRGGSRSLLPLEMSRVLLWSVTSPSKAAKLPRLLRGLLGSWPIYLQDRQAGSAWPGLGLLRTI